MSEDRIVDSIPPFCRWNWHAVYNADLVDPLPQFLDADEEPLDLTGGEIELFVVPTWGHATTLYYATSAGVGADITIDDADEGLATLHITKDDIQENIPVGKWQFFLRVTIAGVVDELARGDFYVWPGNDAFAS